MGCDCFKKKKDRNSGIVEPLTTNDFNDVSLNTENNNSFIDTKSNLKTNSVKSSLKSNRSDISDRTKELNLHDFQIIKTLGRGAYGYVALVCKNRCKLSKYYAMKIINKESVKKNEQYEHVKTEREILAKIDNPFVLKLCYAFQNRENLYLLTEFVQGGELVFHLREKGSFKESWVKIYSAELIIALECLHKNNLIYRDLKPENILIDVEGHIKLIDFGLSKIINTDDNNSKSDLTFSICGTPEYLAPEVIKEVGYNKTVDWWSLGVLIYEMLTGSTPFYRAKTRMDLSVYQKPVEMHSYFSDNVIDLLENLLLLNPDERLGKGVKGSEDIKNHIFFKDINWDDVKARKLKAPIIPKLSDDVDSSNFSQSSKFLDQKSYSLASKKSTNAKDYESNAESNRETDPEYYEDFYYDYENEK